MFHKSYNVTTSITTITITCKTTNQTQSHHSLNIVTHNTLQPKRFDRPRNACNNFQQTTILSRYIFENSSRDPGNLHQYRKPQKNKKKRPKLPQSFNKISSSDDASSFFSPSFIWICCYNFWVSSKMYLRHLRVFWSFQQGSSLHGGYKEIVLIIR